MPAPNFSDFDGLTDVLGTDRFELLIEPQAAPGINRTLALRCQQIAVPSVSIEQMIVAIGGFEYAFRGRKTYEKTIAGVFVETIDGELMQKIGTWKEQVAGSESGNGVLKKQYSTLGTLNVYGVDGNVALSFGFQNLWPMQRSDIQLSGESGTQAFTPNLTFSFDRLLQDGVAIQ